MWCLLDGEDFWCGASVGNDGEGFDDPSVGAVDGEGFWIVFLCAKDDGFSLGREKNLLFRGFLLFF